MRNQKRNSVKPKVPQKLSFEISLDQDDEVMSRPAKMVKIKKRVTESKNEKEDESSKQMKKVIPKKFIAHIVTLGFNAEDAARLYESKDDWLGMSSGVQILCVHRNCKFSVPLSSDALFEHCRTVHGWRNHPCDHDNCNFIAYSKTSFKIHLAKFHSPYKTHNGNYFSCPRPNCKAAFLYHSQVLLHEKIHDNDVLRCVFCPYVNAAQISLSLHQRIHFNSRDYVCDVCQKAFTTPSRLREHLLQHETTEATTQCPLCDRVSVRRNIKSHLNETHKVRGSRWDDKDKQYIVPKQIES